MKNTIAVAIGVLAMLALTGCDQVLQEQAKMDADKRVEQAKAAACGPGVVLTQTEYAQLKRDADAGKSIGRYQTQKSDDLRTWRLDTVTGHICLMLATDYDWKHSKEPRCADEDAEGAQQ